MSCPTGFVLGLNNSCHVTCPQDFKYVQSSGGSSCVYTSNNQYSFSLNDLPVAGNASSFTDEQARVGSALTELLTKIQADTLASQQLHMMERSNPTGSYGVIQSQHAAIDKLDSAIAALKPPRQPTQPYPDINLLREMVNASDSKTFLLLQIAAFTVFVCIFLYLILPKEFAHFIVFLILCSTVAVGISLSST
uniref:Uncharacterized protein n=1 Tax=viral metagenome TaxID=1070528 RepID=A0A6C0M0C3_9ZZZZ